MTGEPGAPTAPKPLTYTELRAKYAAEADREYGGTPPWGGEREQRFYDAVERINTIFAALHTHRELQRLSDGQSGTLSEAQVTEIGEWQAANEGLLMVTKSTQDIIQAGTAFGFVESQVVDIEATAAAGLEVFAAPEAQQ